MAVQSPREGEEAAAGETRPDSGGTAERWGWLAPLLAAVPAVVATVAVLVQGWTPYGDQAFELLRVAEVGTARTPLVGAYSRWGWDHPGPLLFWLAAPAYRLLGPVGLPATAGLVNAGAAALAVLAARRIGGSLLGWLTAVAALAIALSMGGWIADPWNPYVGVLPLLACLLCAWRAAEGDLTALLGALVTGSYALQAHLGSAPVVAAAALATAAAAVVRWRRGALSPSLRGAGVALTVALVLWSGPLVEQVASRGGNLREIWDFTWRSGEPTAGWWRALQAAGHLFGVPAPWMGAEAATPEGISMTASPVPMAVVLAVAAGAAWGAWRRGDVRAAALAAFAIGLVGTSVVGVSRITGLVAPYLLLWTWPVAALVWVAGIWAVSRPAPRSLSPASAPPARTGGRGLQGAVARSAPAVAAVAAVALAGLGTVAAARAGPPTADEGRAVASLSAQVRDRLDPTVTYGALTVEPRRWGSIGDGVTVDLQRRGWDVLAPRAKEQTFKAWRVTDGLHELPVIVVVERNDLRPWSPPRGARCIATYDSFDREDRRALAAVRERILRSLGARDAELLTSRTATAVEKLAALGRSDRRDTEQLEELLRDELDYEVWLLAPGERPSGEGRSSGTAPGRSAGWSSPAARPVCR